MKLTVMCKNCKYYEDEFCKEFLVPVEPTFDPARPDCYKQRKISRKEKKEMEKKTEKARKMFEKQEEVRSKYYYGN